MCVEQDGVTPILLVSSSHLSSSDRPIMDSDHIDDIKQRIAALDKLHYVVPSPADHATTLTAHEAEFWSARLEERQLLQAHLDSLLTRKAG